VAHVVTLRAGMPAVRMSGYFTRGAGSLVVVTAEGPGLGFALPRVLLAHGLEEGGETYRERAMSKAPHAPAAPKVPRLTCQPTP